MTDKPRKPRRDKGVKRKEGQDAQYSFRLDPTNEYERQAIEIIQRYLSMRNEHGHPYLLRQIITAAMLHFNGQSIPSADAAKLGLDDLAKHFESQIERMDELIQRLTEMGVQPTGDAKKKLPAKPALSQNYLANLQKALRGDED